MEQFLVSLSLLGTLLHASAGCSFSASEFQKEGDYLIGGLFDIHHASGPLDHDRPEVITCSSKPFLLPNYRRFQLMRFAIEEINNSTDLLPNVSLGYELFDHCSDTLNFPDIFKLISDGGVIRPWGEPHQHQPWEPEGTTAMAVVGPFTSTQALAVAPLFMMDLIPMVSYGTTSTDFSDNTKFPSFLRTIPPNKDTIEVIVTILQHFGWHWVAFLNSDNDFGIDGLQLFRKQIERTDICLAYAKSINDNTNYSQVFEQIEAQKVNVIIGFAPKLTAEALIQSATRLKITDKVWIADDGWSLNKMLPKLEGIQSIGTVLGVSQPVQTIPGFDQFIRSTKSRPQCGDAAPVKMCHQTCNCEGLTAEHIVAADPSFSFPVYSAVYAIAHAMHNILQCGAGTCHSNVSVHPYMVLAEMQKSNFTLLNQTIQFAHSGDPKFGFFSIVFWNISGDAQEIGNYKFYPSVQFFINSTEIQWHTDNGVPTSVCSPECSAGFAKKQTGVHKCCFDCEVCPKGTYINTTKDASRCVSCSASEWSAEGSTSCSLRLVEFVPFTDAGAVVIMVAAWALVALSVAVCVLFALHSNTPVVRSAGGPMCFLILVCLSLCSVSVFFYFGQPTLASCVLRFLPFLLFYTVCLACFVVRSFQIVCIFKMAAKFPKLYSWWMKYHGQWLLITVAFTIQALLLLIGYSSDPPKPFNETYWYHDKIILSCELTLTATSSSGVLLLLLCCLCFIFSYMGKDLPKNYNEAKSITFCLLILILTWIIFATEYLLYHGKYIQTLNALAVLSSLYSFLLWYFLPKCVIIIFQPHRNTQQYFQGLIQSYTKTISQ